MKRSIVLCMIAISGMMFAATAPIRSDDFESYAEGIADGTLASSSGGVFQQSGRWWAIPTAPHVMEIAATTGKNGEPTKALRYRKTGEGTAGGVFQIMGSIPRLTGRYVYEATIRNGDDAVAPFYNATYAGVRFLNNGSIACMSADGKTAMTTLKNAYPVGKWFTLKAEYTIAEDSVTVYIDGEKTGTLALAKGALANLVNPRWDFGGYGTKDGVLWIDNVVMSGPDNAASSPAVKAMHSEVSVSDAMGFERDGAWSSVPPDLLAQMQRHGRAEDELASSRAQNYRNSGVVPARTVADLNAGVGLSKEHVRQGTYAGYWADHHRYPSIISMNVEKDVSRHRAFSVAIFSAFDTGEVITVGILSDDAATASKDWYFFKFSIDWKGWKRIEIPFSSFTAWERPVGWSNIGAIAFFTKAFGHQPSPHTALWLDDIRFTETASSPTASVDRTAADGIIYRLKNYERPGVDHGFPELPAGSGVITPEKAICHGYYFNYERAMYGYDPRFQPGYVSFDPAGKAYVWAGDRIQWLDAGGKWTYSDLAPGIIAWGKAQGWTGIRNGWGSQGCDPMIRFDNKGDAYVLANVTLVDEFDKEPHWSNRTALLLHSRDAMKTWQAYRVPGGRMANFEKLDGHNTDCLANPPVILNGDITYFPGTDLGAYLVLPVKNADGTLRFDGPYKYAENAVTGNFHSGDGNVAVSAGG